MKRWFVCFNELSEQPLCQTDEEVEKRIHDFAELIREIRSHTSVTKVRYADYMTSISLTGSLTMQDYCNSHINDPVAIVLLSSFIRPQVDMDNDNSLQSYLDTTAEVELSKGIRKNGDGFNAAYCQNTFCVGFESNPVWERDYFNLTIKSNGKSKDIVWACISSSQIFDPSQEHRLSSFAQWLKKLDPVELVPSTKEVASKPIHLRDDHGKDKLAAHAEVLCRNQYVEGVLMSLEFKPRAKDYIARIHDDGTIDVVLFWEEVGYSMRVKTTGRNAIETREIARLLREKFVKKN